MKSFEATRLGRGGRESVASSNLTGSYLASPKERHTRGDQAGLRSAS